MAQVYVPQRVNVYLRDGTIVNFVPGINDVPAGAESDPFMANLIAATANRVAAQAIIDGEVLSAAEEAAAAQELLDTAVVTTQAEVLTAETAAGETWATNRQAAIDAGIPYNVRHPNNEVAQAIAVTAQPSQVAGSDFLLSGRPPDVAPPTVPPVNDTVPAVLHNGAVVTSAAVGDTLTCTMGTWENTPNSYAYAWQSDGATVGANSSSYTVVVGDSGHSIDCVVTATNAAGSTASPISNSVTIL
jgi:hypothetical protein